MWNNCFITWYDTDVLNIHLNIHSPYDLDMLWDLRLKINRLHGSHHKSKGQGSKDMLSYLVLV